MPDPALPRKFSLETTARLVDLIAQGNREAREALVGRYLFPLQRYTRGRLPWYCRSIHDTDDLVQNALMKALGKVEKGEFKPERQGSFMAYLRRTVMSAVIDEIRRQGRLPERVELDFDPLDPAPDAVKRMIGQESLARYQRALETLAPKLQDAVIMFVEMECTYPQIAVACPFPTPAAARMAVTRALARLAQEMKRAGGAP